MENVESIVALGIAGVIILIFAAILLILTPSALDALRRKNGGSR